MIHTTDIYHPKKNLACELTDLLNNRLDWLQKELKAEIIEVGYTSCDHAYIVYKT